MSYSSGEAAEQVVRMTLNGVEVAAKISGKAAERLAVLLYAVLQDQKKTRGKTRLTSMLKSGKELKVFSVSDGELERFCREAIKYGVLYCVLKDKTDTDGHFVLKPYVGTETVSWMCILGAAPFAAMGFITYNGMTAEQFVWAWLRSEMIEPKQIKFEPVNIYYEALKDTIDAHEKEVYKNNDKEH